MRHYVSPHCNESDMKGLLKMTATRGYLGMLRSIQCQHGPWKNCTLDWAGQFEGKERTLLLFWKFQPMERF